MGCVNYESDLAENPDSNADKFVQKFSPREKVQELTRLVRQGIADFLIPLKQNKTVDEKELIGFVNFTNRLSDYLTGYDQLTGEGRDTFFNNVYVQQLLQQVSRYNAFFNQIMIEQQTQENPLANHLSLKPLNVVSEYIQPGGITIKAILSEDNNEAGEARFQPGYYEYFEGDRTRYHYNEKTTLPTERHQDSTRYFKDNMAIFRATQASNLSRVVQGNTMETVRKALGGDSSRRDKYFLHADQGPHQTEKSQFGDAGCCLRNDSGKPEALSPEQVATLQQGHYYTYPQHHFSHRVTEEQELPQIASTHIGHASELVQIQLDKFADAEAHEQHFYLKLVSDPVHGHLAPGVYPRETSAAFAPDQYPDVHVVFLSHNHRDHEETETLRALSLQGAIIVVPVGDRLRLLKAGVINVIELPSWSHKVDFELSHGQTPLGRLVLTAVPANHASNREMEADLYAAGYMGCQIYNPQHEQVKYLSGDTGIWHPQHYQQRHQRMLDNEQFYGHVSVAGGPDRPRSHMRITHQSSADALVEVARLIQTNVAVYRAKQGLASETLAVDSMAQLRSLLPLVTIYHQGCFRLGTLRYSDVRSTVTRMLMALRSFGDQPLNTIDFDVFKKTFPYVVMDQFERDGLQELIIELAKLTVGGKPLTAREASELLNATIVLPTPGSTQHVAAEKPVTVFPANNTFQYDYLNLLLNRHSSEQLTGHAEFEALVKKILPLLPEDYHEVQSWLDQPENLIRLCQRAFAGLYPVAFDYVGLTSRAEASAILNGKYRTIRNDEIFDEKPRLEDKTQTAFLLVYGLIYEPEFCEKVHTMHQLYRGELQQSGRLQQSTTSFYVVGAETSEGVRAAEVEIALEEGSHSEQRCILQ